MEERLTFLSEGTTPRKNLEVMQEAIKEAGAHAFEVFCVCLYDFGEFGKQQMRKVTKLRKKRAKKAKAAAEAAAGGEEVEEGAVKPKKSFDRIRSSRIVMGHRFLGQRRVIDWVAQEETGGRSST